MEVVRFVCRSCEKRYLDGAPCFLEVDGSYGELVYPELCPFGKEDVEWEVDYERDEEMEVVEND